MEQSPEEWRVIVFVDGQERIFTTPTTEDQACRDLRRILLDTTAERGRVDHWSHGGWYQYEALTKQELRG